MQPGKMVKIAGIDPGLAGTGVAVIHGNGTNIAGYSFGSIITDKQDSISLRLNIIYGKISDFLSQQAPDLVVIEDIFSLGKFPGSGITLAKVSGVLLLAAFKAGVNVEEISVREAKKIVSGSGSADKHQVERSVRDILGHKEPIRPFHASDALALSLCGYYRFGREL